MVSPSPVQHHGVAVPDRQKETERTQRTRKREAPCDIDHRSRRTERSCDFQRRVDMAELRIEGALDNFPAITLCLSAPPQLSLSLSLFAFALARTLGRARTLPRSLPASSLPLGTHGYSPSSTVHVEGGPKVHHVPSHPLSGLEAFNHSSARVRVRGRGPRQSRWS